MSKYPLYEQSPDGTRLIGYASEPDPNAIACENPGCGLYRTQDIGIEPGRWICGQWWCADCLTELKARAWHWELDYYALMWDLYPDLMATLGE